MTKPLISYYGGKQKIASWICKHIPKHTVYVEPFCGGAAVFFRKPMPIITNSACYREVLNDTNKALITLYKVASNESLQDEFINKLQCMPYSRELHSISVAENKSGYAGMNDLEIAVSFFYNIETSFSNILNSGFSTGLFGRNSPIVLARKIENISDILARLRFVFIECLDAIELIKKWDSPQTFFYCDPPYIGANQGHYKGYTKDDFLLLVETLSSIKGSFLLSHYENSLFDISDNWDVFSKGTTCTARCRTGYDRSKKMDESKQNRKRKEVLYRKLATKPRKEIVKLYATGNYDCFPGPGWKDEHEKS